MTTGQPDTDTSATEREPPVPPPPLPQAVAMVLAALSVVMIVGGGVVAGTGPTLSGLFPTGSTGPHSVQPLPPVPGPGPRPNPSPSPVPPEPSPTGIAALAALSAADARAELQRQAAADAEQVAALAGSWVPQVSSKCTGLKVDIGPDWMPNGRAETSSVTMAQIAAFHASLRDRFGALTAHPVAVGIDQDTGTHGSCAGLPIWISLVPRAFAGPAAANAWCDAKGLPGRECGARSVMPGGKSKFVARD